MQTLEQKVQSLIEPSLTALGYRVVRIRFSEQPRRTLQVMAERLSDHDLSIEDCTAINDAISHLLDVEDPIPGKYHLEVSSPGIDRPLVSLEDFDRYKDNEAKLVTLLPIDGRRRFSGNLLGVKENEILMEVQEQDAPVAVPFDSIESAKLILTDALITKHQKQTKQTA